MYLNPSDEISLCPVNALIECLKWVLGLFPAGLFPAGLFPALFSPLGLFPAGLFPARSFPR